ncbi:hypothetical protein [Paraburkholderia sediminicola]|uniref:hypothetical protein n=1 Tax=Paraburkholderia sediminicola TaxID=458836 RepID=UPI0038B7908A
MSNNAAQRLTTQRSITQPRKELKNASGGMAVLALPAGTAKSLGKKRISGIDRFHALAKLALAARQVRHPEQTPTRNRPKSNSAGITQCVSTNMCTICPKP